MLLSIIIILALVCGREGSGVQENGGDEISSAAAKDTNNTETQRYDDLRIIKGTCNNDISVQE